MKFTTIMAVMAVALVFATSGCRYNKGAKGAGGSDGANVTDISAETDGSGAQEGDISAATGSRFEDLYKKCTDVEFAPAYFGFDSNVLPQGEFAKVDAVVQHLQSRTERVVVIEGNCDERGSDEYNLMLGEQRAGTIRDYMVQSGIAADRIQTRSYGEERPAVKGSDESAWSMNRRGEFVIFTTK